MKKVAIADLYFLTESEGGQERLIARNFSTPILFDEDFDQKFGLWSAVIEFIELPNEERKANAKIYFLFSENMQSPSHLLIEGHTFKLINKRTIAIGKIREIVFEE